MGMPTVWNWRKGREFGYEYPKEVTNMTNNKQADALYISAWLGRATFPYIDADHRWYDTAEEWLSSNAGTVAMIEALRTRDICALVEVLPAKIKNLNLALQSAVLELIGGSDVQAK